MRIAFAVIAVIVAAAGCSSARNASSAQDATPAPLAACETRELDVDGADVVVSSNADASLASVRVVEAPDAATREAAVTDVERFFGPVRRDARVIARPNKWGLTTLTDACGRPAGPTTPAPQRTTPNP